MATTSSVSGLAAQLRLAVVRTARRLRRGAGTDLSPTLTSALATVERHGPLTPSELAAREGVRRPTATRIVAKLEAQGLVERSGDPHDGRPPPRPLLAAVADGRRPRAAARPAHPQGRLPGPPPGGPVTRGPRPAGAR